MQIDYFIEELADGYILTINDKRYACDSYEQLKNRIYESYRQQLQKIVYSSTTTMSLKLEITENPVTNA